MASEETPDFKQLYELSQLENARLLKVLQELQVAHNQLLHRVDLLLKKTFGSTSERHLGTAQVSGQLRMELEEEVLVEVPANSTVKNNSSKPKESNKEKKKHFSIPENLVDEVQEIHPDFLPEGSKCIGTEVSYRLKGNPTRLSAKKIVRFKYLLPTPEGDPGLQSKIIIAPLPEQVIKNCMADASLLATLVVEKYCDHLPIYRQMTRFDRAGIKLAHSTLLDWASKTCSLLTPLYDVLKSKVMESDYLMMDETTMKVMDKNKKGRTHRGYYWAVQDPQINLMFFEYRPGRGKEIPESLLRNFKGYLQSDGYTAYESLGENKDIALLCCNAHARRYFIEAQTNDPVRSAYAIDVFSKLYDIERMVKEMDPNEREQIRREQAKPIWESFGTWLEDNIALVNEKSAIYKAIAYTMKRFKRLSVYMDDPKLNIDNNPIESSIRAVALGRRNFLFSGSHEGAQRSAMFYSFMGTCKLHSVNPMEWMVDVLEKIKTQPMDKIHELLPDRWKINNQEKSSELNEIYAEVSA